jgi:hypothetical protein
MICVHRPCSFRASVRLVALLGCLLILFLFETASGFAQTPPPEIQSPAPDTDSASAQNPPAWWQRFHFSGDFRARFEMFRQEGMEPRNRGRIRLRLNLGTDINDEFAFGLRLATGNPLDPTTSNQSFDDFLTRKPFTLHRAYLTYTSQAAKGLKLGAGIFEPPITMSNQIWDDNISWAGGYEQVARSAGPISFKAVAAQVVINELSASKDALMFAESGEVGVKAGAHSFSATVTDYQYRQADQIAVAVETGALDTRNSNLLRRDAAGHVIGFVSQFHLIDVIGRATLATGNEEYPLVLTADWVRNLDAVDNQKTGIWLEGTLGLAEKPKTLELNYIFARLQRDAALGPYVFDDLERATNQTMHYVKVSYAVMRHVNLEFAGIFAKPILVGAGQTRPVLTRLQFSTRVTF